MSTLNSSSTDEQVRNAYDDNASYAENDSVSECKAFITACRILLRREFKSTSGAGISVLTNMDAIAQELREARVWLNEHGAEEGFDVLYPGQAT